MSTLFTAVSARTCALATCALLAVGTAHATTVLFVGNSFTYGDAAGGPDLVRPYKPGTVTDLRGTGIGGVPALFKAFTLEKGLSYDVSLETQPGVGLDYHYNSQLALINKPWDNVVLQSYSTLDVAKPGDPTTLIKYSGLLADLMTMQNSKVNILLDATWSRADQTYKPGGHWYGQSIYAMEQDVLKGYQAADAASNNIDGVIKVGQAWARTWETGLADSNLYDGIDAGKINMWAPEGYHASVYGYYMEALMFFGQLTGVDPMAIGYDQVAKDLGISSDIALALQKLASQTLAGVPEPETFALLFIGLAGALTMRRRRR